MIPLNPPNSTHAYHQVWFEAGGDPRQRGRLTLARMPSGRFQTIRELWSTNKGKTIHDTSVLRGDDNGMEWSDAVDVWNNEMLHLQTFHDDRLEAGYSGVLKYHQDLRRMDENDGHNWTVQFPVNEAWTGRRAKVDETLSEGQWNKSLAVSGDEWPKWRRSQMPRPKISEFEF